MCAGKGILAEQENFGHVAECGCGTLHVAIGPVTVALDEQALRRLHEMIGTAIVRLEENSMDDGPENPLLMHGSYLAVKKLVKLKH